MFTVTAAMPVHTVAERGPAETKSSTRELRVLLNALSARLGGGQTYVRNLLEFLPDDIHAQILVLAPESLPLPVHRENIHRIAVRAPMDNPMARAAWEKFWLPRLLRQIDADVFFCPGGIVGASVPQYCKTVTVFRNMIPFDLEQRRKYPPGYMRMRHWILKKVLLRSMKEADLVIFISELCFF